MTNRSTWRSTQNTVDPFTYFTDKSWLTPFQSSRMSTEYFLTCPLRILYTFLCTAERTSTSIAAALVAEGDKLEDVANGRCGGTPRSAIHPRRSRFLVSRFLPRLHPARSNFDDLAFSCNEPIHHNLLGESCFRVMKSGLRLEIYNHLSCLTAIMLRHSPRRSTIILVLFWGTQLATGHTNILPPPQLEKLRICISDFLQIRVIFWIEEPPRITESLYSNDSTCTRVGVEGTNHMVLIRVLSLFCSAGTIILSWYSTPYLYISVLATLVLREIGPSNLHLQICSANLQASEKWRKLGAN